MAQNNKPRQQPKLARAPYLPPHRERDHLGRFVNFAGPGRPPKDPEPVNRFQLPRPKPHSRDARLLGCILAMIARIRRSLGHSDR